MGQKGSGKDIKPIFSIDWESWMNAVIPKERWDSLDCRIQNTTNFLLGILDKYEVKAIIYSLGWLEDKYPNYIGLFKYAGHLVGSHGYWHGRNEYEPGLFRSPYWDKSDIPLPPSGGFFFRAMPLSYVKWAVKKSGMFWIHPHDVDEFHPILEDKLLNWKRHIGLKTARKKLDCLLNEVEFDDPWEYFNASQPS